MSKSTIRSVDSRAYPAAANQSILLTSLERMPRRTRWQAFVETSWAAVSPAPAGGTTRAAQSGPSHRRWKAVLVGLAVWISAVDGSIAADVPADASGGGSLPSRVRRFAADKERQVRTAATKLDVQVMPAALDFFGAAKKGNSVEAMDAYREVSEFLRTESKDDAQNQLDTITGEAAQEVNLALTACIEGESGPALAFGESIVRSIPAGSIYFGGTDPGRALPAALCESHEKGVPFFTLSLNALIGERYRDYVRSMYEGSIAVPSKKDSDEAFRAYLDDASRRYRHDVDRPDEAKQLLPGEEVTMRDNRLTVGGAVAVTQINGILLRKMLAQNPTREFYLEQNYPVAWMFPHLTPHGLVMKVNREVLERIAPEVVETDRKFWQEQQRRLIGNWLKPGTSVKEVCAFAERIFAKHDRTGFSGDAKFVENRYAGRMYSTPRGAIAGVYAWRATTSKESAERERMSKEADFAYRQAFALCPSNEEAVTGYAGLLRATHRLAEAKRLADTAVLVDPGNAQFERLARELASVVTK